MSTTGERIRELRLRHRLTLDDVAHYLGVGKQAIYKYEQGTVTNIPLDNLEKMATLFGTTPGYLAGWEEDHPYDPLDEMPHTLEARLLAQGVDNMPKEQREHALNIMKTIFVQYADYFINKETNNDDTEL